MATLHQSEQGRVIYVKGSAEAVLSRCNQAQNAQGQSSELHREDIEQVAESFAEKGLRVLAFAQKSADTDSLKRENIESGLTFLGLQGMIDPPREEAIRAVDACQAAGIQVKMVTGDHAVTASAISSG